jgi:hypothetical protein
MPAEPSPHPTGWLFSQRLQLGGMSAACASTFGSGVLKSEPTHDYSTSYSYGGILFTGLIILTFSTAGAALLKIAATSAGMSGKRIHRCSCESFRTPSGTFELAVSEKQVGERNQHTNFIVALNRSDPDLDRQGENITTTVLNPQYLLREADL